MGHPVSEETRRKISETQKGMNTWSKGRVVSEETRRKLSNAGLGHSVPEHVRRKVSEACKGRTPWIAGRKHTKETREKMRFVALERMGAYRMALTCLATATPAKKEGVGA